MIKQIIRWINKIPLDITIALFVYTYMIGSATIMLDQYYEIKTLQEQVKILQLKNK